MKKILLFLLLFGIAFGETRYFLPVTIESSNGRPILDADVDLYQSSVKIEDCTWLSAGRYYYTDTTVVTPGAYDIYVNSISWQTNTYINYGATTAATIAAVISDSISFPTDTTALKLLNMDEGRVANLKQLGTDPIGGGWCTVVDSSDYGSILTTATKSAEWFEHPTTDRVWIRDTYLIRRVGFPENFGALGDGSTDDYLAIQNVLSSGIPIYFKSGNTYVMSTQVTVLDIDISINSTGSEKAIFSITGNEIAFEFNSTVKDTTSLIDSVMIGDYRWTVKDPAVFAVGDLVSVISKKGWYYGTVRKGEMQIVKSIDADTVFFEMGAEDTYNPVTTATGDTSVIFYPYVPISVDIRNIKIDYPTQRNQIGMQIYRGQDVIVDNIEISGARSTGLQVGYCYGATISNSVFRDNVTAGAGYGISTVGSKNIKISNNRFYRNKRAVDITAVATGHPSRYFTVDGNYTKGGLLVSGFADVDGYGTHVGAEFGQFINNIATGISRNAFKIQGADIVVEGNLVVGAAEDVRSLGGEWGLDVYIDIGSGANHTIRNNTYASSLEGRIDQEGEYLYKNQLRYFISMSSARYDSTTFLHVTGNTINAIRSDVSTQAFLEIINASDSVYNVTVKNNVCVFANHPDSTTGTGYFVQGKAGGSDAFNWNMSGNTIETQNSDFTFNLADRITFSNSYVEYTKDGTKHIADGLTNYGGTSATGVTGHEVQLVGANSADPPDLVFHTRDAGIVAGDTLGFIRWGPSNEASLGRVYYDLVTIRTESSDIIVAEGSANGELILSARDGVSGLIDIAKLDGNDQTFEILNLKIGDLAGGGATIDSAYVDADSLKFRVGAQWYKMEKAD